MNNSALRVARIAAGMTQSSLADAVYGCQGSIWKYENGKAAPSVTDAINICRVLRCDPEQTFLAMMDEQPLEPIGKINLAAARANVGMTQKEVTKAIGVQNTTYNRWEKGAYAPDIYNALKLCRVFGCKLNDIDWE